jgi:pimeloyl-CoA dehydrogenase
MDFSFNDDHIALRDAVRRFCDGEYPAHERGNPEPPGQAAQRWAGMAELGLLGLPFDPELGGSGQGPVELMLVAQELGRALAAGPWLSSVVLAGALLARHGTPDQCARWIPGLASGERRLALALQEPGARHDLADVQTAATASGPGYVLNGRKSLVLGGDSADVLLVVARTAGARRDRDGLTLFALDAEMPGLDVQRFAALDARGAAHLRLSDVRVGADRIVGTVGGAFGLVEEAADRAAAALVADAAGALEALLELTAEHLRTRKQFGAPLAKFQALQHRIADLVIGLEQAKSMACAAAMALDGGDAAQRRRLVSAAKAFIGPLGRRAGFESIQMHGAMGMTDECRAGHYAKRLMVVDQLFGDAQHHLRRFTSSSLNSTETAKETA